MCMFTVKENLGIAFIDIHQDGILPGTYINVINYSQWWLNRSAA